MSRHDAQIQACTAWSGKVRRRIEAVLDKQRLELSREQRELLVADLHGLFVDGNTERGLIDSGEQTGGCPHLLPTRIPLHSTVRRKLPFSNVQLLPGIYDCEANRYGAVSVTFNSGKHWAYGLISSSGSCGG